MFNMPFQKGNQLAKGNGWLRRDPTIELITQLNELCKNYDGTKRKRTKLNRLIANLITKATDGDDVLDTNGQLIKEGTGDLHAILAVIDRIEGKPAQKIVGADNGPVQVQYKAVEEVHMFLLERGIDSLRVPPLFHRRDWRLIEHYHRQWYLCPVCLHSWGYEP